MLKNALGVLCVAGCLGACAHHPGSVADRENRRESAMRSDTTVVATRDTDSDDTVRADDVVGANDVRADDVAVTMPQRNDRPARFASTGETLPVAPTRGDDTALNARDRNDQTVTPMDQGSSAADTDMTARIRKAIMNDESLSFDAKNVKVVTQNGHVTLRGPVKSSQERLSIARAATDVAGVGHVTNDLEIAR